MLQAPPLLARESTDDYDAVVTNIHFVMRREPDPRWTMADATAHQRHVMAYAIAGKATYDCGNECLSIDKGDLLLFPKELRRSGWSDPKDPWEYFTVGFDLHFLDRAAEPRFHALPYRIACGSEPEVHQLFNDLERAWIAKAPGYTLRSRSILLYLLSLFVRHSAQSASTVPYTDRLTPIVRRLQEDYARSYSVNELAAMADLSPSRFRSLFKELTGHSVTRFQNLLRINRAKDLLLSGEYTVTETAERLGFRDVYYFSRLFKKMTGVSPSSYRQQ